MKMSPLVFLAFAASIAHATPTGSPLIYQPVDPCRVMDTRVTLGPLAANTAMDIYVRGRNLPVDQGGAGNCGVPLEAESVVVNVIAITPTASGHFKLNATGGVAGSYSRVNYTLAENVANELAVGLCNVFLFPAEHQPCPGPVVLGPDVYADLQLLNVAVPGSFSHVVVDVIGYFARMPLTSAVSGVVTDKETISGSPDLTILTLSNGLRIACSLPWSDSANCEAVQVGWTAMAAGHIVRKEGDPGDLLILVFAHGPLRVDQN